jgi:hypothetical protein
MTYSQSVSDRHQEILARARALFEAAPWLKDSKNVIHLPIKRPGGPVKAKDAYDRENMPPLSWADLYELVK